ncbi:MAG: hypothetical protein F6K65_02055 [Moorea sp. SIO3C2]|nr:hypothetical protein [Moorena sp. SIO3C2]
MLADQGILYEVRSGTLRDAIRYSCGANHIINSALVYTGAMQKCTDAVHDCRLVIFDRKFV